VQVSVWVAALAAVPAPIAVPQEQRDRSGYSGFFDLELRDALDSVASEIDSAED
jgi:hypothetical protein